MGIQPKLSGLKQALQEACGVVVKPVGQWCTKHERFTHGIWYNLQMCSSSMACSIACTRVFSGRSNAILNARWHRSHRNMGYETQEHCGMSLGHARDVQPPLLARYLHSNGLLACSVH